MGEMADYELEQIEKGQSVIYNSLSEKIEIIDNIILLHSPRPNFRDLNELSKIDLALALTRTYTSEDIINMLEYYHDL